MATLLFGENIRATEYAAKKNFHQLLYRIEGLTIWFLFNELWCWIVERNVRVLDL